MVSRNVFPVVSALQTIVYSLKPTDETIWVLVSFFECIFCVLSVDFALVYHLPFGVCGTASTNHRFDTTSMHRINSKLRTSLD